MKSLIQARPLALAVVPRRPSRELLPAKDEDVLDAIAAFERMLSW